MPVPVWRPYLLLATSLICLVVVLFPFYWIVITSILPTEIVLSRNPPLLPPLGEITFAAYFEVFARKPLLTWISNSMMITAGTLAITISTGAMAGYSLSRFRTKAQQAMGFGLLASKMLPGSLIIIPFFILFSKAGLIESKLGVILANSATAVPFATWLLKGFFDAIPRELEQAAMIDGCNEWQAFRHIVLPLAAPGLAAASAYIAIVTWADLVFARTLNSKPDNWVVTVGLQSFTGEYLVEWGALMAASAVSLLPMLVLFLLLEPFLVKGSTQGSLAN
ncbi:MAG: carbohydrate ABC transporter permease [Alphaproteobacteria bacterium]|nr:carbohydrate ABC transporter permease [Alphaproteobacteria bacterium]MBN9496772.1 carbohydrate ABC transporter permease [Alphaproteobacteria bacterium]